MWCYERFVQDGSPRKTRSFASSTRRLQSQTNLPVGDVNEVKNHFKLCFKLFNENKINGKNAWNLKIIDQLTTLLTYELNGKDAMVMAAMALDVCSKVYACRVDDLHCEGLQLAMTLNRLHSTRQDDDPGERSATNKAPKKKMKRLRGNKSHIVRDPNAVVRSDVAKLASTFFTGNVNIAANGTENLFTNKLPMDCFVCKFALMDKVNNGVASYDEADLVIREHDCFPTVPVVVPTGVKICAPLAQFNIDERGEASCTYIQDKSGASDEITYDENGVPIAQVDGSIRHTSAGNFNAVTSDGNRDVEMVFKSNETDGEVLKKLNSSLKRRWTGPSHWRSKIPRRSPARSMGSTPKSQKTMALNFDEVLTPLRFTKKYKPVKLKSCPRKCTLPPVLSYECDDLNRLIVKSLVPRKEYECDLRNDFRGDFDSNGTCGIGSCDEKVGSHDNVDNHLDMTKNLVDAPETVAPLHVSYVPRANKMDMKRLKSVAWDRLTACDANYAMKGRIKETTFRKLCKTLPKYLPPFMKNNVSLHLAFVTLLHLANENDLKLTGENNLSDVTICN